MHITKNNYATLEAVFRKAKIGSKTARGNRAGLQQRYTQQRSEARFTMVLAAISVAALLYYYAQQILLLYGDAVAHINIARRVVDNRSGSRRSFS